MTQVKTQTLWLTAAEQNYLVIKVNITIIQSDFEQCLAPSVCVTINSPLMSIDFSGCPNRCCIHTFSCQQTFHQ